MVREKGIERGGERGLEREREKSFSRENELRKKGRKRKS